MKEELNIWVVGGDRRQGELARLLARDGHTVHTFALERFPSPDSLPDPKPSMAGAERADCIVLPMTVWDPENGLLNAPLSPRPHPLLPLLAGLGPRQILCGGRVDQTLRAAAEELGLTIHDYFAREELAVANAVPTAEGAVQLAMEQLPITIHGARVLVIGFGRVGRLTAQRFAALGAQVRVAARRWEQLAWAEAMGFGGEQLGCLAGWLCSYDLVINTVPAPVLGLAELRDLRSDCLILDLASDPGGVDAEAARQLGLRVIRALALPGRVAPISAGAAIKSALYNILRELGL